MAASNPLVDFAALCRWPEPEHGPGGRRVTALAGCHQSYHWLPPAGGLSQSLGGGTEGKPPAIRTDAKRLAEEEKGAPTTPITPAGQDCHNFYGFCCCRSAVTKHVHLAAATVAVSAWGWHGFSCGGAELLPVRPAMVVCAAGLGTANWALVKCWSGLPLFCLWLLHVRATLNPVCA